MEAIKVENLTAILNGRKILDGISFSAQSGEIVAVIGANGVGKSTLLKCMGGLLPCDGQIEIFGRNLRDMSAREVALKIAWLHQSTSVDLPYTVMDFVSMSLFAKRKIFEGARQGDREIVTQALKMVGASQMAHRPLNSLSGGERQRVYLAATIAQGSEILFLDEPTSFMDIQNTKQLNFLMKRARNLGQTVIVVTHDINFALQISDKILALKDGRLAKFDRTENFLDLEMLKNIFGADFEFAKTQGGKTILSLCY